jgi:type I restriction enzyme R subunit
VVDLLQKAFRKKYGACEHEAVVKITGNADKPAQLIRFYKNERNPRVAVTVDLLTTGIDVPEITNLVFLRRVRSRILYEQMIGRATRLCKDIGKRYFRIFDAVDLYSALEPYSSMKPVVTNPSLSFAKLVEELGAVVDDPQLAGLVCDQLRAKLQRKRRGLSERAERAFAAKFGIAAEDLSDQMKSWDAAAMLEWWNKHGALVTWLDREPSGDGPVLLISDHEDELLAEERGYGAAGKPDDYLESFGAFIRDNINLLPALKIVTQRPRDLTRKQLRELKLALDEAGFTEARLESAWRDTTNQEVVATIIGHIRRQALGSPLVPYEERVTRAMDKILASRTWSGPQSQWLRRIGDQLAEEPIVDREALSRGAFKRDGGFRRLNKVFDGKLEELLGTLHEELWSDAG